MNKITLNELVNYLPHELKVLWARKRGNIKKEAILTVSDAPWLLRQPVLIPIVIKLSDLTSDQLHELGCILTDHTFQSREWRIEWAKKWLSPEGVSQCNFEWSKDAIDYLHSIHADLNGWIEKGLAIDKKTI
jgi:hypothetical protein